MSIWRSMPYWWNIAHTSFCRLQQWQAGYECTHSYNFFNLCTTQIEKIRLLRAFPQSPINAPNGAAARPPDAVWSADGQTTGNGAYAPTSGLENGIANTLYYYPKKQAYNVPQIFAGKKNCGAQNGARLVLLPSKELREENQ